MTAYRIDLPWDGPLLFDNDRHHWAVKARLTRTLRYTACTLAQRDRIPTLDRARITLHWQPAIKRRRDQLSIAPTLKGLVDGLVDAGVLADDDHTRAELTCRIEPVAKPAALWLTITEIEADQ